MNKQNKEDLMILLFLIVGIVTALLLINFIASELF